MKNNQFEIWIYKIIKYYKPILGIDLHNIKVERGDTTKYLEITCTYPYLDPIIRYSNKAKEDWGKGHLKSDRILHELCHIITDPLYSKAVARYVSIDEITDERERLTDIITAIIRAINKYERQ